jgi:hypothetical protein
MAEYGGRAVDSSQDARSGRKIWTERMVLTFWCYCGAGGTEAENISLSFFSTSLVYHESCHVYEFLT